MECRQIAWTRAPWASITRAKRRSTSPRKVGAHFLPYFSLRLLSCPADKCSDKPVTSIWIYPDVPSLSYFLHLLCSPSDYTKGFGGKFGVETDKVDKSAVGFEYQGKTEKHESQKGGCH